MEKIKAVEMVRKIRDEQYTETKHMSRPEYFEFIKEHGEKSFTKFRNLFKMKTAAADNKEP